MPLISHRLQVFECSFDLFLQEMSLFAFAQQFVCCKQLIKSLQMLLIITQSIRQF